MAEIDRKHFADQVADRLQHLGLSYAGAVAQWPGTNKAMLSRACSGQALSSGNFLLLCRHAKLPPFRFLIVEQKRRVTLKSIVKQAVTVPDQRETRVGHRHDATS